MTSVTDLDDVLYEVSDRVATITINRPAKLNAFRRKTLTELITCVQAAAADREVGVLVLTGAGGRAFSAGGDVGEENADTLHGTDSFDELAKKLYAAFRACLKPIIARIDGYAIGGGHHMAYMCDLTIASSRSTFGQNGARVASPAEGWFVTYLWPVVGMKRAKEIWMLCRRYTAEQAYSFGLVNSVVPADELDAEVRQWCDDLLSMSPTVLKLLKKSFDDSLTEIRERHDYVRILDEVKPDFWQSGEQAEGAAAFLEKRRPNFDRWR